MVWAIWKVGQPAVDQSSWSITHPDTSFPFLPTSIGSLITIERSGRERERGRRGWRPFLPSTHSSAPCRKFNNKVYCWSIRFNSGDGWVAVFRTKFGNLWIWCHLTAWPWHRPIYLLLKISAMYALLAAIVRWVRGNHQACFLLSHPVFLVLAIGNVANTSVHRLCLCRFQSVCKCLVCVWAGTIGVRVKWVVGRWQHGDHYQKGNVCLYVIHCWASRPIMCWSANHDWPITDFR